MKVVYFCKQCGRPGVDSMVCECGGTIVPDCNINITGTRDGFGIGKAFTDERTGKVIDNWRSHEKAGFRDYRDHMKGDMKEAVKDKIKRVKRGAPQKPLSNESLPL